MLRLIFLVLASGMLTAPAAQAPATQAPAPTAALAAPAAAQPHAGDAQQDVHLTQNTGSGRRVAAFWFILPNR